MMRFFPQFRWLALGAVLLMILTHSLSQASPTLSELRWYSEEYAPLNFSGEDGIPTGITVDLLQAMMHHLDEPFDPASIQILPWARGYRIIQEQPNTCLFGTNITETRRELFHFVGPAVDNRVTVIAPRAAALSINTIDELSALSIGVVREDIGELLLLEADVDAELVRSDSARSLMRMLAAGRFDAIAYGELVTFWTLQTQGIAPEDYETVYVLSDGVMGYACHRDTDPTLLARLQQALDTLIAEGTVQTIQQNYTQ